MYRVGLKGCRGESVTMRGRRIESPIVEIGRSTSPVSGILIFRRSFFIHLVKVLVLNLFLKKLSYVLDDWAFLYLLL